MFEKLHANCHTTALQLVTVKCDEDVSFGNFIEVINKELRKHRLARCLHGFLYFEKENVITRDIRTQIK
jgi:hypothetical protein